jgi:CheY-like chemotaxis protein
VLSALERTRYDIILMDIHMPQMDGLEASRRIRDKYQPHERPRIIALSADTLQALHDRWAAAAGRGARCPQLRLAGALPPASPSAPGATACQPPVHPRPPPPRCREAGIEEFIVKPFRVEDLRRVVRCAPRRPSAGPGAGGADGQHAVHSC